MVTCDPRDRLPEADTAKHHPVLIVEVLSDSTAAYDRGLKFEQYRTIPSLREYLLVEQGRRHADLFRREDDGRWLLCDGAQADEVFLESVGQRLALATIYEDVEFAKPAEAA
jgi:Uma2 family endonuclease